MDFKHKKLHNGLHIIGEVNPGARSAAVGFFVKTGARDEQAHLSGVSHFLEHMLFKGTDRMDALSVNEAFDKTGAQFNAFTSEETTAYYAAALPEYILEVAGLWIELMRPALRQSDFELERQVVLQEIAMYRDQPDHEVMERCRCLHYDGHPCGNLVIGTEQTVGQMTCDQMRQYFQQRYVPDNMAVVLAGNLDWDRTCGLIEAGCSNWKAGSTARHTTHFAGTLRAERATRQDLSCEHICLMHQAVSAQDPGRFAAALLGCIVGDDVGSRYYWHLVDKAIAQTAVMQYWPMDGTGTFCSYFACRPDWSGRVLESASGILRQLHGGDITSDELERARNKVISAMVIRNELPMGRLMDLALNWLYLGQYRTVQEDMEALKAVTPDDLNELVDQVQPWRFTAYVLAPEGG